MVLKPQDVLVLLKLVVIQEKPWSYNKLAIELGMSPAEVHAAAKRLQAAQLLVSTAGRLAPSKRNLGEFLAFGLRYVFVPERGEMTRGMPTLSAAPPLRDLMVASSEPIPVWPDPSGEARGSSFSPLYKSVPKAARADTELYELLVLVDAVRGGRAREREIAISMLNARLTGQGDDRKKPEMAADHLRIGDQLVISRAELKTLAARFHIRKLSLFGSAARGDLRPESDIDLLVEFEPGKAPSLGGMLEISDAFSVLFGGRPVDVATASILENPYRRRAIERDMELLYAA
jgi:predicted nucleotidyltransferase